MPEKPILNKGLDALLGDVEQPNTNIVKNISTNKITPNRYQPRTSFNDEKLSELADSIKQHGILSPIIVREASLDQYEIIAGERRFRAAKNLKLKEVPCLIENTENQQSLEIALIENLQRENLNPVEEARGYDRLKREFNLTQEEISGVTGKARSTIANAVRLLSLNPEVLSLLESGKIERGHAKILISLPEKDALKAAKKIAEEGLTVKDLTSKVKKTKPQTKKDTDVEDLFESLSESVGHKISIQEKSKKTGQITIQYFSADEREIIIKKLSKLSSK